MTTRGGSRGRGRGGRGGRGGGRGGASARPGVAILDDILTSTNVQPPKPLIKKINKTDDEKQQPPSKKPLTNDNNNDDNDDDSKQQQQQQHNRMMIVVDDEWELDDLLTYFQQHDASHYRLSLDDEKYLSTVIASDTDMDRVLDALVNAVCVGGTWGTNDLRLLDKMAKRLCTHLAGRDADRVINALYKGMKSMPSSASSSPPAISLMKWSWRVMSAVDDIKSLGKSVGKLMQLHCSVVEQWYAYREQVYTDHHRPKTLAFAERWNHVAATAPFPNNNNNNNSDESPASAWSFIDDAMHRSCGTRTALGGLAHRLHLLLTQRPALVSAYFKVLEKVPVAKCYGMLHLLSAALVMNRPAGSVDVPAFWHDHRSQVLKWMENDVLGATKGAPAYAYESLAPLYRFVSHDDMATVVMPYLERMCKRAPDAVLRACIPLWRETMLDTSRYLSALASVLLAELVAVHDDRRLVALAALHALMSKASDAQTVTAVAQQIVDTLVTKTSVTWQIRASVAVALDQLRDARAGGDVLRRSLGELCMGAYVQALAKESHAGTRTILLRGIRRWADTLSYMPPTVYSVLATGIKGAGKDAACVADYLYTWLHHMRQELPDTKLLQQHMNDAVKKPAIHRAAGVLSAAILLNNDAYSANSVTKEALAHMSNAASFVNTPAVLMNTVVDTCVYQLQLLQCAVRRWQQSGERLDAYAPFFTTIVYMLVDSAHPEVRRLTREAIQQVQRRYLRDPVLVDVTRMLIRAFTTVIRSFDTDPMAAQLATMKAAAAAAAVSSDTTPVSPKMKPSVATPKHGGNSNNSKKKKKGPPQQQQQQEQKTTDDSAPMDSVTAVDFMETPLSGVFLDALHTLCGDSVPVDLVPEIMVVAHHALVSGFDHHEHMTLTARNAHLRQLCRRVEHATHTAMKLLRDAPTFASMKDAWTSLLLDTNNGWLYSGYPLRRGAAQRALLVLSRTQPDYVSHSVVPALVAHFDVSSLLALSGEDVAVYRTPDGVLCEWEDPSKRKVQIAQNRNVANLEEKQWEEQLRAELRRKQGVTDPEVVAKIHAQSQQRMKLRVLVHPVVSTLEALRTIAALNCVSVDVLIRHLVDPVFAAIQSPLVADVALEVLKALISNLDPPFNRAYLNDRVALALYQFRHTGANASLSHAQQLQLQRVIDDLEENCRQSRHYSAVFLNLITPLLEAQLLRITRDTHNATEEKAKQLLAQVSNDFINDTTSGPSTATVAAAATTTTTAGANTTIPAALQVLIRHCECAGEQFPIDRMLGCLLHMLQVQCSAGVGDADSGSGNNNNEDDDPIAAECRAAIVTLSSRVNASRLSQLWGPNGLRATSAFIRLVCVEALAATAIDTLRALDNNNFDHGNQQVLVALWLACNDTDQRVADAATALWDRCQWQLVPSRRVPALLEFVGNRTPVIRVAAGNAIAAALTLDGAPLNETLVALFDLFKNNPDQTIHADMSLRRDAQVVSRAHIRSGVMVCLSSLTPLLGNTLNLLQVYTFLFAHGLSDHDDTVWQYTLDAGLALIEQHGAANLQVLNPLFEKFLAAQDGRDAETSDRIREGGVIFIGSLARHSPPESEMLVGVVDRLLGVLATPSYSVQKSVADCLVPLVATQALQPHAQRLVDHLLKQLATGKTYGERKGAAFGIAALVKGLKLSSLKKYNILESLSALSEDKTSNKARQGALFVYERLFAELGSKFEPYVVLVLPHLLASFGDTNPDVLEATRDAARMIMSVLTEYGVKMVLPLVLKALEERQWRKRIDSIALLGAMAYCAPLSLSACLPMIVPRLLSVMQDPHQKVQLASREALQTIGSVVRNPEILNLVPVLLDALADPTVHTKSALQALVETPFSHRVDPPSLALVIPVLRHGLKDRSPTVKKIAAQVCGSICALIMEVKDLLPYANTLLKYLKSILVDPSPDVRTVAAQALGALYKGIGESHFDGLIDWLLDMLKSDTTSVQRSGAAQGLAQVLHAKGLDRLESVLDDIFAGCQHHKATVREGYIGLFVHIPVAFGDTFAPLLERVLPIVIQGLDDEIGHVRDVALEAAQTIVTTYAVTQTRMLQSALMDGMIHPSWRVRQSCVQLVGGVLRRIAGQDTNLFVGGQDISNDDESKESLNITWEEERSMREYLGDEMCTTLYAGVYLMRSDVVPTVRSVAWRVWKAVVHNTHRTLKYIFPRLMQNIIFDLASSDHERQQVAGFALGDLVQKMGESVLAKIIPILRDGLTKPDVASRRGVCLGIREVMASGRKSQMASYMQEIIPAIRDALCDESKVVRAAAGEAFDTLYTNVGSRAIDDILPSLIAQLDIARSMDEEQTDLVLEGMREVLNVAGKQALEMLVPILLEEPLSVFHAQALASLSDVLGNSFYKYVPTVLESYVNAMVRVDGTDEYDEFREAIETVLLSVDQLAVHAVITTLLEKTVVVLGGVNNATLRRVACDVLAIFLAGTAHNIQPHVPTLFTSLLALFVDESVDVQTAAWTAVDAIVKQMKKEKMPSYVGVVRASLQRLVEGPPVLTSVPGLCLKRGLQPILPLYQEGLVLGSAKEREEAALGLKEAIMVTTPDALKPFVVKITGPLIRISGDRFPSIVKAAILETLGLMLLKASSSLKPFLPQLQTTFVKALHDPSTEVRQPAVRALAHLMQLSRRVDPLVKELLNEVESELTEPLVRVSLLSALHGVLQQKDVGDKVSAELVAKTRTVAAQHATSMTDPLRDIGAQCWGALAQYLSPDDVFSSFVNNQVLVPSAIWQERHGRLIASTSVLRFCASQLSDADYAAVYAFIMSHAQDDNATVRETCLDAVYAYLTSVFDNADDDNDGGDDVLRLMTDLLSFAADEVSEIRQKLTALVYDFVRQHSVYAKSTRGFIRLVIPVLVKLYAVPNIFVRRNVHRAMFVLLRFDETTNHNGSDKELWESVIASSDLGDDVAKVVRSIAKRLSSPSFSLETGEEKS